MAFNFSQNVYSSHYSPYQLGSFGIQNPSLYTTYNNTISLGPSTMRGFPMNSLTPQHYESPDPKSSSSSSLLSFGLQRTSCTCFDSNCEVCLAIMQKLPSRLSQTAYQDYQPLSPLTTPSPPPILPLQTLTPNILCERHPNMIKYYCQTCSLPICGECELIPHMNHVTVFLNDAIETANIQSNAVLNDLCSGMQMINNDIHSVMATYNSLEIKSKEAAEDLNRFWDQLRFAVDERQKTLLREIELTKNYKWKLLREKENNLNHYLARLKDVVNKQRVAMETSKATGNPIHAKIANDTAIGLIAEIQNGRSRMLKSNEDWIVFRTTEKNILEIISTFGCTIFNNPGSVGDGRILRGRGSTPPCQNSPPKSYSAAPNPRGRPIPSCQYRVVAWTENRHPREIKIIGNHIFEPNHPDNLCRPWGVACDKYSNIIVADRSNDRIIIFREDGSCVRRFGCQGSGPRQFNRPAGIVVDERRRIVVADKDNHRIQILTMEGAFLLEFGERGAEIGQFNYPWDVASNSACEIIVSDTRNHRIQLFSAEGIFLRKFNVANADGTFKLLESPRGVAFTPEGNVVLTDFNTHHVVCVDYAFTNAEILRFKGEINAFYRPQGVIIDDDGNILVADSRGYKIKVFNKCGDLITEFGKQGTSIEEMDRPADIALLPDGRIVFVDFGNNRVVIR